MTNLDKYLINKLYQKDFAQVKVTLLINNDIVIIDFCKENYDIMKIENNYIINVYKTISIYHDGIIDTNNNATAILFNQIYKIEFV